MVLYAGFASLLCRLSGQSDFNIGTPIANRNRSETENLIGFFVNTLVLRTPIAPNTSFKDLLVAARQTTLEAYVNKDVPFEHLVEDLHPQRDLSRSPLFQVLLVLQNTPAESPRLNGLKVEQMELTSGTSKFDLTLALTEQDGCLKGYLEYNTDILSDSTIGRWRDHLVHLLSAAVQHPERAVGELPLLSGTGHHQLVTEWNRTDNPMPAGCIHELFERQALTRPDRIALIADGQTLSYAALRSRSNPARRGTPEYRWYPSTTRHRDARCAACDPEDRCGLSPAGTGPA